MNEEGPILGKLTLHIERTLGTDLPAWPGGWPDEIEAALLDVVFSIRARYGGPTTGVRGVVNRWQGFRGERADDLGVLATHAPEALADVLGNHSRIRGRLKAEVAIDAAVSLRAVGLRHAKDFTGSAEQKRAYLRVNGLGPVTWSYLGMLLGHPDVKADVWVMRFIQDAIGPDIETETARQLLIQAAENLDVSASQLDHAIWLYERSQRATNSSEIGRSQPCTRDRRLSGIHLGPSSAQTCWTPQLVTVSTCEASLHGVLSTISVLPPALPQAGDALDTVAGSQPQRWYPTPWPGQPRTIGLGTSS